VPARDLHIKPFDEGTKTKLEIYRGYVRAWLQVFLHAEAFRGKPFQFSISSRARARIPPVNQVAR
jgi:hypothetical protein